MTKSLEEENQELKTLVAKLSQKIDEQAATIKLLQNRLFGKKTEVFEKVVEGQQSLFNDQQLANLQTEGLLVTEYQEVTAKRVVRRRSKPGKRQRTAFLDKLEQVDVVIPLEDTACPYCHEEMTKISKRLHSREATLKPAELYCKNIYQETYKCRHCHPAGKDVLVNSKVPQALLPHSYFSSSILAKMCELKFDLALPFHRQLKLWTALGFPNNDKYIANNAIKVSETYLKPLYDRLVEELRKEAVVHMDETPLRVLEEHTSTSYLWAARSTTEFNRHNVMIFHYANTRSGRIISEIVGKDYQGTIIPDGYSAYSNNRYPKFKFGACLVHIRREFIDIVKGLRRENLTSSKAVEAIQKLGVVFETEKRLIYHTKEEKRAQRQLKLRPLLDKFYSFISEIKNPIGRLRVAIENALNQQQRVYRIFEDGQIPLSNNPIEQMIRPTTLIRKNSLFARTIRGAHANAIYCTLVATAKLNGLNVYKYLEYLFSRLPNRENEDIGAYLPWAKEVQEHCRA